MTLPRRPMAFVTRVMAFLDRAVEAVVGARKKPRWLVASAAFIRWWSTTST